MGFKLLRRKEYVVKKGSGKWNSNSNLFWGVVVSLILIVQLIPIVLNFPNRHSVASSISDANNEDVHRNIVEGLYERLYKKASEDSNSEGRVQKYDPIYGFILVNGYRMDSIRFAAIGLGATSLKSSRYFRTCHWISLNGSAVEGKVKVFYPGEHHDHKYETVIIHCTLPEIAHYRVGGKMYVSMEGRQMLAYEEKEDYKVTERIAKDLPYQVAFCSPPIHSIVDHDRIREWLKYHSTLHFDYMVIYNAGGVGADLKQIFEPYIGEGMLQIVDVVNLSHFDVWNNGRVAFMNDCAYRMRHRAKWVMYMDFNEYWNSLKGEVRIRDILGHFNGHPYVTFGSLKWSVDHCTEDDAEKEKEKWAVERLVYRQPDYYCSNKEIYPSPELCLGSAGYRRIAVNPRMVASLQPHQVQVPSNVGVDVDANLSHVNRYPGLLQPNSKLCNVYLKREDEKVEGWIRSWQVSDVAHSLRSGKKAW